MDRDNLFLDWEQAELLLRSTNVERNPNTEAVTQLQMALLIHADHDAPYMRFLHGSAAQLFTRRRSDRRTIPLALLKAYWLVHGANPEGLPFKDNRLWSQFKSSLLMTLGRDDHTALAHSYLLHGACTPEEYETTELFTPCAWKKCFPEKPLIPIHRSNGVVQVIDASCIAM